MVSPKLQINDQYPSILHYRRTTGAGKATLRAEDQDLRQLRSVGEAMINKIEQENGGEWYLSMVQRVNGDFCSFPHPHENY